MVSDFNVSVWFNMNTEQILTDSKFEYYSRYYPSKVSDGVWICVDAECLDCESTDCGEGDYEFWGECGVHHSYRTSPTAFELYFQGYEVVGQELTEELENKCEKLTIDDITEQQKEMIIEFCKEA